MTLALPPVAVWTESPCKLGGVGGVSGDASHRLHASTLELRVQIENRVGELGEDQDLLVRERLRQERVERAELGIVHRVPRPVGLEQAQEGVGVRPELAFQDAAEEVGAEPLEASLVPARVLRVHFGGALFKAGRRPSAARLLDFLFLFVVVRIKK